MLKIKFIFISILLGWSLFSTTAFAGQTPYVPKELASWKEWVLFGNEKYFCPAFYNEPGSGQCLWPEVLELDFIGTGGNFIQKWTVLTDAWIPLPGSTDYWPQRINLNGNPAVAVPREGVPCIHVFKGRYLVSGEFLWDRLPQAFPVPPITGLISLKVNGRLNKTPFIDDGSQVWIQKRVSSQEASAEQGVKNLTDIRIFRLIEDTIPLTVHNLIRLKISGEKRREKLESVLFKDSLALSISSPLPAKLAENDDLWIEVKPGQWDIHILTAINRPVSQIGPAQTPYGDEIWSFKPYPHLRLVTVEGLTAIDPSQTSLPGRWQHHSSFLVKQDDLFRLKETQRGSPETVPDALNLVREFWLDFDGLGATIRDQISGRLGQRRFLGINGSEYDLGRLILNGRDQLVTGYKNDQAGIELEKGPVHLTAISRLKTIGSGDPFSIGWGSTFESAKGELNLPPGWSLLGVQGGLVPENSTWVDRWSLLDFFIILIISVSVAKLWHWRRGIVFFIGLTLIWQELYAPQLVWLSLVLTTALLRLFRDPDDMEQKRYRLLALKTWHLTALVILAGCVMIFSFIQLRSAIYPQLEPELPLMPRYLKSELMEDDAPVAVSKRRAALKQSAAPAFEAKQEIGRPGKADQYAFYPDQEMITQTGPGIPTWKWKTVPVSFDQVSGTDTLAVWLVSPLKNRILSFVRVAFLLILVLCFMNTRIFNRMKQGKWAGRLTLVLMTWALACAPNHARADIPSPELLKELEKRLLAPHDCFPACASIPNLEIRMPAVRNDEDDRQFVDIRFELNAAQETAVPLPSGKGSWRLFDLKLDGESFGSVIRNDNDLWMKVPEGSHMVRLRGVAHDQNEFEFVFPLNPYYVKIDADDWRVSGLDVNHQVGNVLKMTRKVLKEKKQDSFFKDTTSDLNDFFKVKRNLLLGLEWTAVTTVERLVTSENQGAATVSIPLIEGEQVGTENLNVQNGFVHLEFPPGINRLKWNSALPITPAIELAVPEQARWAEVWRLEASPLWHYTMEGLPVTYPDNTAGTFWYPWPGEKLAISLTALKATPGRSLTIDAVRADYHIGKGYNQIKLNARIRTSRGGQHPIISPENTLLKSVAINGVNFPVTGTAKRFMVPLKPGTQTLAVEWHEIVKWETGWVFSIIKPFVMTLPEIDLLHECSNIDIFFHLPNKYWLLLTGGPRLGPAVLIWSFVLVIVFSAVLLGKFGKSILKIDQWILLGLGLVLLEPVSIVLVAAWFLAIGVRKKVSPGSPLLFNLMQICLVVWSLFVAVSFYRAVQNGLLGIPDMQVAGNGSTRALLHWTQDRSGHILPRPWVGACSLYAYRAAMFLWALWLASNAVSWTKWAFQALREKGGWKRRVYQD